MKVLVIDAVAGVVCVGGLALAVLFAGGWIVALWSVLLALWALGVVVDHSGLGERWAERMRRGYLDYRLGDRR